LRRQSSYENESDEERKQPKAVWFHGRTPDLRNGDLLVGRMCDVCGFVT
jgi:hypothetical protein